MHSRGHVQNMDEVHALISNKFDALKVGPPRSAVRGLA
jgi:hypothetical protein